MDIVREMDTEIWILLVPTSIESVKGRGEVRSSTVLTWAALHIPGFMLFNYPSSAV